MIPLDVLLQLLAAVDDFLGADEKCRIERLCRTSLYYARSREALLLQTANIRASLNVVPTSLPEVPPL
jgi:hypothetical protein